MPNIDKNLHLELRESVAHLPHLPGVYRYLDAQGNLLYVGKAVNLQRRVSSYFQKNPSSARIRLMVAQIAAIEVTVTRSAAEALILENNLIKAQRPRYNIVFRDDKSYPYVMLSAHTFPRLAFYRGPLKRQHRYFGPFANSQAVRESIQLLQKIFRLRTCEDQVLQHRTRPCLLHQIKRCSAPCTALIRSQDYQRDVSAASEFLQGKTQHLLNSLSQRMHDAAAQLDFEHAALYRDQLQALASMQQQQFVSSQQQALDIDIIACANNADLACVHLVMVRGGRHVGDKNFFPNHAESADKASILEAFISQHYLQHPPPAEIICELPEAKSLLANHPYRIKCYCRPRAERRVWLSMAQKNAELAITQQQQRLQYQATRLQLLNQRLYTEDIQRIECIDISHTMGEATVGACVVYANLAMQPKAYRRYNISAIQGGDDYAAIRQVLQRRYQKAAQQDCLLPDLLLIDGGQGQVNVAIEVLRELGLNQLLLVGVAKGKSRKPGQEQLIVPAQQRHFSLEPDDAALHLIQEIRDEAHRFAIVGHRARRSKQRTRSCLEGIPGVGSKRRQQLLSRFGSVQAIRAASVEDLCQIHGIYRTLAEKIYNALR